MGMPARFSFFLQVLHHVDVLGDDASLHVVAVHVRPKGDHVDSMEAAAVDVKEGNDLKGQHLRVEGVGVL